MHRDIPSNASNASNAQGPSGAPGTPGASVTGAAVAAAVIGSLSGVAQAQVDLYRRITPPNVPQGGNVGAALLVGRQYQGSDESRVRLLPNIEYQWRNGLFAGAISGIGYNASSRPDMAYGVRVTPEFGRKERRSGALRGLGDIEPRAELGAFFNFSPASHITLGTSLRYGSGNDWNGLVVDVGAGWSTSVSPRLRLGTSLVATWVNAAYVQEFFGVDADQAARSGYAPFAPGAGLRDVRLGASLVYRIDAAWNLAGLISYSRLVGDAEESPIVREKGTVSALFALGYRF